MLSLTLALFLGYLLLLAFYTYQWGRVPIFNPSVPKQQRRFSVLIPTRNEADNIGRLLLALNEQQYPVERIEIIVVDDHSTDNTAAVVKQFPFVKWIQKDGAKHADGKKASLSLGIQLARHEWILTTDADCVPGAEWISTINVCLDQRETLCLAGPVLIRSAKRTILQSFQRYDNLMFQGITAASLESKFHAMGNGANLCYRKDAFEAVNGFDGIDQMASGDDVFLIEKFMQRYPGRVHFLKSEKASVKTNAAPTWKMLWQQRIRWASKAHAYKQPGLHLAQWMTGLFNLALIVQSVSCIFHPDEWKATIAVWIYKTGIEWFLIHSVAVCYRERRSILTYFLLQPIHVIYIVALGLLGRRKKYDWKGRSLR